MTKFEALEHLSAIKEYVEDLSPQELNIYNIDDLKHNLFNVELLLQLIKE